MPNYEEDDDQTIANRLSWYSGWCTDQNTPEHDQLGALLLEAKHRLLTLSRAV